MKPMKKHNIHLLTLAIILVMFGTSCKKSFFTDANQNLNAPANVTEGYLLGPIENSLAYSIGGDMSRFTSILTQQTTGAYRQSAAYNAYIFTEQDVDGLWANLYENVLYNDDSMISMADNNGNNGYAGIGRVIMAYTMMEVVDMWGDVPYTQSLQALQNLTPVFDNDQDIYNSLLLVLDQAIGNLGNVDPGLNVPDGSFDNIYQGDEEKWIKFAHAVKARLYIHQSKLNPALAQNALDEANLSFTDNSENAVYIFGTIETNAAPWYQFNEQRGDITFDVSTLADTLVSNNDPRYNILIAPNFDDVNGVGQGEYYGEINSPVELIAYDEIEFIKAEATLRTSGDLATAAMYDTLAIQANMQKLGIDDSSTQAYIAANAFPTTSTNDGLFELGVQEWIALYLNPEAFTSWRRLNSPNLVPVSGSEIPRRFLYPQAERSYNAANTPQATLFTPLVFWDTP